MLSIYDLDKHPQSDCFSRRLGAGCSEAVFLFVMQYSCLSISADYKVGSECDALFCLNERVKVIFFKQNTTQVFSMKVLKLITRI